MGRILTHRGMRRNQGWLGSEPTPGGRLDAGQNEGWPYVSGALRLWAPDVQI